MSGRPERSSRGKRSRPTQLQEQRDQAFYSSVFGVDEDSSEEYEAEAFKKPLSVVRGQMMRMNLQGFPYSRSHHYYNDLSLLNRVGDTNYVEDPNYGTGLFHFNDQQLLEQYRKKGFESVNVINRQYMGLPARQPKTAKSVHGDKNPCHAFLFNNQDRKWRIDQLLCELRYLKKNPDLVDINKARLFSSVKRDPELASLYDVSIPLESKILLLDTKIAVLQARRTRLAPDFEFEDELFYHSSQNQKYFNDQSESELSVHNILSEGMYLYALSREIRQSEQSEEKARKVSLFFSVYSTIGLSNPVMTDILNDFVDNHITTKIPPTYIMNFSNTSDLQRTEQVLSIRTLEMYGQTVFYGLKSYWKKIFNKELTFESEFVPMRKEDYADQMRHVIRNYQPTQIHPPNIPNIVIPPVGNSELLLGTQNNIRLTHREYILTYLAYYIYERIGYFNIEDKLIGSESFAKYQFKLSEEIGEPFAATLEPAIKQFVSVLSGTCDVPELNVDVFWELTPSKTGLIWMREKQVWETEEEEEEERVSEQQVQQELVSEPSRIEGFDQPNKRIRELDDFTE